MYFLEKECPETLRTVNAGEELSVTVKEQIAGQIEKFAAIKRSKKRSGGC